MVKAMEWDGRVNTNFGFEGEHGYEPESVEALRFESGKERRAPRNSWAPMEYPLLSLMLDNKEIVAAGMTELGLFRRWYEVTLRQGTLPFRIPRLGGKVELALYNFIPDSLRYDEFKSPVGATFGLVEAAGFEAADPNGDLMEWVREKVEGEAAARKRGDADTLKCNSQDKI